MFFDSTLMNLPTKYQVWCLRRNDPDALWSCLPYAKRSKQECEALVDYYEAEWGSHYIYEVILAGFHPQGLREPDFV